MSPARNRVGADGYMVLLFLSRSSDISFNAPLSVSSSEGVNFTGLPLTLFPWSRCDIQERDLPK